MTGNFIFNTPVFLRCFNKQVLGLAEKPHRKNTLKAPFRLLKLLGSFEVLSPPPAQLLTTPCVGLSSQRCPGTVLHIQLCLPCPLLKRKRCAG